MAETGLPELPSTWRPGQASVQPECASRNAFCGPNAARVKSTTIGDLGERGTPSRRRGSVLSCCKTSTQASEVSRPTARSAITHLVAEGLLRREAHKPAYVPVLSEADVRDLFLVRTPLELEVVRLLAGRRSAPAQAGKAVDDLAAIGPERPHSEFVEAGLGFHRALVAAVDSPRLGRVYQALSGEIHLSMVQSRHAWGRERIVAEHCGVLGAIEAGDADRAAALMRSHLDGGVREACAGRLSDEIDMSGVRVRRNPAHVHLGVRDDRNAARRHGVVEA
jgi:DNA-binding GntR family transcriptional regulator